MEERYRVLRKHLSELGYQQSLDFETVPLVERLLGDLVKTTESLFHYKNVAQAAIEERDQLQLGAEPYKCDNAKLIKECNDLHLTFLHFKEQSDKLQRDLKHQLKALELENENLQKQLDKSRKTSDRASSGYGSRRTTIPSKTSLGQSASSVTSKKSSANTLKEKHVCLSARDEDNMTSRMDKTNLQDEINKLRLDFMKQVDITEGLKEKLINRDKEIHRLLSLLNGGRPISALNKDCCYKETNKKILMLTEENNHLTITKRDLEVQLSEAIAKQHEAMKRALLLADKNKDLERELRDLDQMALAVEEECNNTLKEKLGKVFVIQDKLNNATCKIEILEREIAELKRTKDHTQEDYKIMKDEKEHFQKLLENVLDDKKRMMDRMNQFQRVEQDLNIEIDRISQICTNQKRQISELEMQLTNVQIENDRDTDRSKTKGKEKSRNIDDKLKTKQYGTNTNTIDKLKKKLESVEIERDKFKETCDRLKDQLNLNNMPINDDSYNRRCEQLKQELIVQEDKLRRLETEIHNLTREKHDLITKLETFNDLKQLSPGTGESLKARLLRTEKERNLARDEVKRLEEERDSLQRRIKTISEAHMNETSKLQTILTDCEEKMQKLEVERRELQTVQGSRRATINTLEEQIETLRTQLRTTQTELEHINKLYKQVKTLQEQTDGALGDSQGQLRHIEMEYSRAQDRIQQLENSQTEKDNEIETLKRDVSVFQKNLRELDAERDHLLIDVDDKTERLASLETDLLNKEQKLTTMEKVIAELKHKLSSFSDDVETKEYLIKNSSSEIASLKKDLENCIRDKTIFMQENKKLQNDMHRISVECKSTNVELERAKREIEDLKTQLQQYVFEIKRAEDLISRKENERAEMLDQFRSLTEEANVLETNNHSLESEALEAKSQLSSALNHISDLESKVDQMTTMNRDYERQISKLTSQIATLEVQVRQGADINKKTEDNLEDMKNLCMKLDDQKDSLMKDLRTREDQSAYLERERNELTSEISKVREALDKERANINSVEMLLATSRQETVEQRLLNQELQTEINRLKATIQELQLKLTTTSQQLDVFQEKAFDYSQQLKQLRREVANERFRAHSSDLSNRYPSL